MERFTGFKKHILFDDNIYGFYRFNKGDRKKCSAVLALQTMLDFDERIKLIQKEILNLKGGEAT